MTSPPVLKLNSFNKQIKTEQSCLKGEALWRALHRPWYSQLKDWPIARRDCVVVVWGQLCLLGGPLNKSERHTVGWCSPWPTLAWHSHTLTPELIMVGSEHCLPGWEMRILGDFCHKQKMHNQNLFTLIWLPASVSMAHWQHWVEKEETSFLASYKVDSLILVWICLFS